MASVIASRSDLNTWKQKEFEDREKKMKIAKQQEFFLY